MITILQLKSIMPNAGSRAGVYLPLLNQFMAKYAITGRMRRMSFSRTDSARERRTTLHKRACERKGI